MPDIDPEKDSWKVIAVKWLMGQGSTNVVLIAILATGIYALKEEVPKHLDSIKAGYKEVADDLEVTRKAEREADKDRYEDHKAVDAARYEWIREGFMRLRGAGIGSEPNKGIVEK